MMIEYFLDKYFLSFYTYNKLQTGTRGQGKIKDIEEFPFPC